MIIRPAVGSMLILWASIACSSGGAPPLVRNSASQTSGDTTTQPIPPDLNLPETNVLVAPAPDDSNVLYYRNVVLVAFDDTVGGSSIRAFLRRYRAEIIGGADFVGPKGGYVLRVPDPGPSLTDVDSLVSRLEREPGVAEATWITYRDVFKLRGVQRAASPWPLLVDRLPDLDTSYVVALPGGTVRVFRTDISVSFHPGVSDSAKAMFFRRYSMRVTGVTQVGRFFVRIPDPGPKPEALLQLIAALRREPEVLRAGWISRDPLHQN